MVTEPVKEMERLALKSAPTIVPKRAPGTSGRAVEIASNITPIQIEKNLSYYAYDIRMSAVFQKRDGTEASKEFTKATRDDFNEQLRKEACTQIFLHLTKTEPVFKGTLIYDRCAILFSTERLDGVNGTEKVFILDPSVQKVSPDAIRVEVAIKQAADNAQITSNDIANSVNADFKGGNKGLMQVLNLATSQIPFFTPKEFITYGNGAIYLLDPSAYNFKEAEAPTIGGDKYTGIGLSKGVKILEGSNKPGSKDYMPALVLDVKKTAFHFDNQPLKDKIQSMYGNNGLPAAAVLTRDLRDLHCFCTHKKGEIYIGGFTYEPFGKTTYKKDGQMKSVLEHYESKYNLKIARPDLPGVIDKYLKHIYPVELLKVAPNQRVKDKQATKETVEALIKVSAIKPEVRFNQTAILSKLLQLNSKSAQQLGVTVPANQPPLSVPARQLDAVKLLGGQGTMAGPSWRGSRNFVVNAKVEKWAAVLLWSSFSGRGSRYNPEDVFTKFVAKFVSFSRDKGMSIPEPTIMDKHQVARGVESIISESMKKAAEAGCTFVLVISDERIKSHDQLKYEELVCKITTQEVTLGKAAQVAFEGKMQTMENIIMKTNSKLRGMNHVLATDPAIGILHSPATLIMGLFVQQPRGMSAREIEGGAQPSMPAVIGLSANNGSLQAAPAAQREMAAQQYFTSGWKYANPKEWTDGETQRATLKKMIVEALLQFKANRGKVPSQVVVYRGGVSEGQLVYIASEERDVFLEAFATLSAQYKPGLVIIAASKEHNERFYHKVFPSAAPGQRVDTNLPPGLVVDRVVVNPEMNEFYLQSHKALQGTAKATKYTILHESTGKLTNDMIQQMTHALCHLHEVVNSTTAIPTPLYVAEECAKRAVNLYQHTKGAHDCFDLEEINKTLGLGGCGARINA